MASRSVLTVRQLRRLRSLNERFFRRFIERFQDLFGTSTDCNVFGEIQPAIVPAESIRNSAGRGNVRFPWSPRPMQEIVMPNDFRLWDQRRKVIQLAAAAAD